DTNLDLSFETLESESLDLSLNATLTEPVIEEPLLEEADVDELVDDQTDEEVLSDEVVIETVSQYICANTNIIRKCDELDGDDTSCRINQMKVQDHKMTKYAPGWVDHEINDGAMPKKGLFNRLLSLVGIGPAKKEVPEMFEEKVHTK